MPTLILSGGAGKDNEKKINDIFLSIVKKSPILYIPIAMEPKNYPNCEKWINKTLKHKKITMLSDFSKKISLSKFKGIYIGGGNTFKLLKEIKDNKWVSKLKKFKGVIAGGSAGAIIFAKDISAAGFGTLKDKNKVKLKDLKGLNLINNYNLQCHYYSKEKSLILRHIKRTKTPMIALPNDSGILVKNKKIKPINKVYMFK
ncbi:MAG: hypothetical protein CMH64_04420 [Nanoarchaeota archaeon]|nr:hypothetical protein [Nanoarchaeota archaeon]